MEESQKKIKVDVTTESEIVDDLRMRGYVLARPEDDTNDKALQTAYRAGQETGRAEIVVEMLDALMMDKYKGKNLRFLLGCTDPEITNYIIEFIKWYLPDRYKEAYGVK